MSTKRDPHEGMSSLEAWRKWFRDSGNAEFWAEVKCIECELGAKCLKTPACDGAITDAEDDA